MVKLKLKLKSLVSHTHMSSSFLYSPSKKLIPTSASRLLSFSVPPLPFSTNFKRPLSLSLPSLTFSTASSPYPLQYEMIISQPAHSQHANPSQTRTRPVRLRGQSVSDSSPENENENEVEEVKEVRPVAELGGFDSWVDRKLASEKEKNQPGAGKLEMDKAKRKYYNKRRKRMYGSDSDEENRRPEDNYVELKPQVVEFPTLHKREEELYFYDAFAYPWEKEKHYKMVYQLEKKYFPDQCLDKAFLEPGESNVNVKKGKVKAKKKDEEVGERDDRKLVFFEDNGKGDLVKEGGKDVTERKVEEFFKCLKKVPNKDAAVNKGEPYLATRRTGLPPTWDGPFGTVVLVNKPKGWTSFTVCGKLRRLVKVKKVGHAGTLDPMATGLLIVCVGKATKLVESYQHMIKGYSGVFRLGEATSTLDADSPIIQREPWEHIRDDDIRKTAASFCGDIWQVPPMFSAIKVRALAIFNDDLISKKQAGLHSSAYVLLHIYRNLKEVL